MVTNYYWYALIKKILVNLIYIRYMSKGEDRLRNVWSEIFKHMMNIDLSTMMLR